MSRPSKLAGAQCAGACSFVGDDFCDLPRCCIARNGNNNKPPGTKMTIVQSRARTNNAMMFSPTARDVPVSPSIRRAYKSAADFVKFSARADIAVVGVAAIRAAPFDSRSPSWAWAAWPDSWSLVGGTRLQSIDGADPVTRRRATTLELDVPVLTRRSSLDLASSASQIARGENRPAAI